MKFAVYDTENTGLFAYDKPADDPCQPRLASYGVVLLDDDLNVTAEHALFVKPDGWSMPKEATAIHGLTDEFLHANGVHVLEILSLHVRLIDLGYVLAAYNAQHDNKQMRGELRRANVPDRFETTLNVCLMRASTAVCKIPGKRGFKWPKLDEACKFFGIERAGAHSALGDAKDAVGVLRELVKRKALPDPAVHFKSDK